MAPTRQPVAEGGQKYVGLTTAAETMINAGSVLRIVCYVLAVLAFVSMVLWLKNDRALGVLFGLFFACLTALTGWLLWLIFTVLGELMYVIIDVEADIRRR